MKKMFIKQGFGASIDKMAFAGTHIVKDLVSGDTNCFIIQVSVMQEGIPSAYGAGFSWLATTATGKFTGKVANPWYKDESSTPGVAQKIQATYATPALAVAAYTAGEGRTEI